MVSYPVSIARLKIERGDLNAGIYFFRLEENTGQFYGNGKLIIH